jgi:hypothetical protein
MLPWLGLPCCNIPYRAMRHSMPDGPCCLRCLLQPSRPWGQHIAGSTRSFETVNQGPWCAHVMLPSHVCTEGCWSLPVSPAASPVFGCACAAWYVLSRFCWSIGACARSFCMEEIARHASRCCTGSAVLLCCDLSMLAAQLCWLCTVRLNTAAGGASFGAV